MKIKRRILSLLLVFVMLLTLMPATAIAANATELATIKVENISAKQGSTAEVAISIQNNPGVLGATLTIEFDEGLTLLDSAGGEAFAALAMTKPGSFVSGCKFSWDGESINDEDILDGTILTLTFKVAEDIANYTELGVRVSYSYGDVVDSNLQPIELALSNGRIVVVDFIPGDVNGDGFINTTDIIFLRRAITGGYGVTINEFAADVNDDGKLNTTDVILIRRWIAGGYGVELKPSHGVCEHELAGTPAHDATCTEDGNIAYWHCEKCGRYFSDANGGREVALEDTVIKAYGHTPVVDPAVPATTTSTGLTEGSHCSVCGFVIVAQEVTPILAGNTHEITYDIANGDAYLQNLLLNGQINNPNAGRFDESTGLALANLEVAGYRFLGWYDGAGDGQGHNANKLTAIPAGTTMNMHLYAHWNKVVYTVQFKSSLFVEQSSATYTVDTGLVLPTPKLSNYVFTGWADENGKLYPSKTIPVGSTGNLILEGNWTSERNKTWTKTVLDEPIIYEDEENKVIYFTYEIGEIQNVPLYTIKDFGYISEGGVERSESTTYTTTISNGTTENIANTISKATTESSNWTLSDSWNESTSLNQEWLEEHGLTAEEAETFAKSDSNNWNVSTSKSGSTDTTHLETNQAGWQNQTKVTSSTEGTSSKKFNAGVDYTGGFNAYGVKAEVKASISEESGYTSTNKNGFETGGSTSDTNIKTDSTVSSSGWSNSSSYGGSSTNSHSTTTSTAISEKITDKYGYGESYTSAHTSGESQGLTATNTGTNQWSNAVTWNQTESESVTSSWTTKSTKGGYHRWIVAGTAHVFAIVGYDMETKSYFVYTYSVMDDETHEFEDYSYTTANYNDQENGVISFEIPFEVAEYVEDRTAASSGLKVDQNGMVTEYTGTDNCVVIPEYYHVGNDVVKVTSLKAGVFANKSISAVVLSDFITEIPENCFMGCTNLEGVLGGSITKIGANAFNGCTTMMQVAVRKEITEVGDNAFAGVDTAYFNCSSRAVVEAAAKCGAKHITVGLNYLSDPALVEDVSLSFPSGTESVKINGNGSTYTGLSINSDAGETVLNKVNLVGTGKIPFETSSASVTLNQSSITATGFAMVLKAPSTALALQGVAEISSDNENAILCRNVVLSESNPMVEGRLKVNDKILVCGEIENKQFVSKAAYEIIDEDTFENLLRSYTLYFNANGGNCDEASRSVANGARLGTLPQPTREQFTFSGWYLEDGTTLVTENSVFSNGTNITIYAHWTPLEYKVTWATCMGSTIKVERKTSPYANAATGTLSSGAKVYYGDTLKVTYTTKTGFTESSHGMTNITVERNYTKNDIYAVCTANEFEVSWSTGTGYAIAVTRTASQYGGADTGALQSGDPIYYGDALTVVYSAEPGYTLGGCGATEITVQGNVNAETIYATATPNDYTYTILYRSSNGTDLGSATATYAFGTTNTITPPAKTGYDTPSAQSVVWDTPSNDKTITFSYAPTSVGSTTKSGTVCSVSNITYSATIEYRNRTATSVQIRVKWTSTIKKGYYNTYGQNFKASVGSVSTGTVVVCPFGTWKSTSSSNRSETGTSGWITVPLSTTNATSVKLKIYYWQTNSNGTDMHNYNGEAAVDTTWTINLPAY